MKCPNCEETVQLKDAKDNEGLRYNYWWCEDHGRVDPTQRSVLCHEDILNAYKRMCNNSNYGVQGGHIRRGKWKKLSEQ